MLVCDECHKHRHGNLINKIVSKIPAKYRYGLTGTLPDSKLDKWCISGIFGSVIYTKTSEELRNNKQISKVVISTIKIHYDPNRKFKKPNHLNPTEAYEEEIDFLHKSEFRNNTITKIVNKVNKNILIMVDRIVHGNLLYDILSKGTTKKVYFIHGEIELQDREDVIKMMESELIYLTKEINKIINYTQELKKETTRIKHRAINNHLRKHKLNANYVKDKKWYHIFS